MLSLQEGHEMNA